MRMPPACAKTARSVSMNGAKPCRRSAKGDRAVIPQFCPSGPSGSGGAPIDRPGQQLAASAPAVRAVHGDADGKVGDQPDRHAAAPRAVRRVAKRPVRPTIGQRRRSGWRRGARRRNGQPLRFRDRDILPASRSSRSPVTAVEIGVKRIEQRQRFQPFRRPPSANARRLELASGPADRRRSEGPASGPARRFASRSGQGRRPPARRRGPARHCETSGSTGHRG